MPDEQRAVEFQIVVKGVDDLTFHFVVKINNDVATKDDLGFLHPAQLFFVVQVDLTKGDHALQLWFDAVERAFLGKIRPGYFFGGGTQSVFVIDPAPGRSQHRGGEVIGRDFDVPGCNLALEHLVQDDGQGVRLFARGAAGGPDAQTLVPCFALTVEDFGQHVFLKDFQLRRIAEEAGFVGGDHLKKFV